MIVDYQFLISVAYRPRFMLHEYPNVGGLNVPCPRFLRMCSVPGAPHKTEVAYVTYNLTF